MKKNNLANFLFEASTLKRLKRTGWQILGENKESIAEHSFMVAVISYVLAKKLNADLGRVFLIALFHDFTESRTGDVYKLADLYVEVDVIRAADDAFLNSPDKDELVNIIKEYEDEKTVESKIVHDADTLALCLELKQLVEHGNLHAREWFEANLKVLKLDESKDLLNQIKNTDSQDWWKKERDKIHKSIKK